MRFRSVRLALLAGTALGLSPYPAVAATDIGKAAAVNPMAHGYPPSAESRVLTVGVDMAANERVVTGPRGQTQLLFVDGSALTVGPNSDIVLDEFVYDPDRKSGKLAFSATKGVFRLVGGQLSKQSPVLIRTQTATVGIRGGIAITQVAEGGGVNATFLFGDQLTVTSGGVTSTAIRPGFAISAPAGAAPGAPQPAADAQIGQSLGQFEGGAGQNGGVAAPPTDEDVAQTQIATVNVAATAPAAGAPAPAGLGGGESEVSEASQNQAVGQAMMQAIASAGQPQAVPPVADGSPPSNDVPLSDDPPVSNDPPPEGPPPSGLTIAGALSGRFKAAQNPALGTEDGAMGRDIPFAGASVNLGVFTGGGFTLPIDDGAFSVPATASPFGAALYAGTGWLSPNRDFVVYELESANDGSRVFGFAGKPTPQGSIPTGGAGFYTLRRDFVLDSDIPFLRGVAGGDMSFAAPARAFIDWGARAGSEPRFVAARILIDGQGAAQISGGSVLIGQGNGQANPLSASLDLRFRGSSRNAPTGGPIFFQDGSGAVSQLQRDGDGFGFFGSSGPDFFVLGAAPGVSPQQIGPGGPVGYKPNVVAETATGVRGPQTDQRNLRGFVGGLAYETDPLFNVSKVYALQNRGASDLTKFQFTTDAFYGTLSGVADLVEDGAGYGAISASFGGVGAGSSAFFDDDTFAAAESGSLATRNGAAATDYRFFMAGSASFDSQGLVPSGVSMCACQFLEWGFLSADVVAANGDRTQVHLANWIAGDVPNAASLPLDGIATYSGHAIGNVFNGTHSYTAVGGFAMTFDFGQPTSGSVTISNFDGVTYNANVSNFQGNPAIYNGNASAAGRNLAYKGTFFQGGADAFVETGGRFRISGAGGYDASGIFAGARTSYIPPN
jgi:hypothetical protein